MLGESARVRYHIKGISEGAPSEDIMLELSFEDSLGEGISVRKSCL